jgi:hypothetical protein
MSFIDDSRLKNGIAFSLQGCLGGRRSCSFFFSGHQDATLSESAARATAIIHVVFEIDMAAMADAIGSGKQLQPASVVVFPHH